MTKNYLFLLVVIALIHIHLSETVELMDGEQLGTGFNLCFVKGTRFF